MDEDEACDYLFTRIAASDASSLAALQSGGLDVVESLLTFALPLAPGMGGRGGETLDARDEAEVVEIAKAFADGRYLVDPAIPRERGADAYRTWAANAVAGRVGDGGDRPPRHGRPRRVRDPRPRSGGRTDARGAARLHRG